MMCKRWGLGTLLWALGCSGSNVASPEPETLQARAGAPAALANGTGGSSSSDNGAQLVPPQPDTGRCANTAQVTLFAQATDITGVEKGIALTETHVYWNTGTAVVRQAKAGGSPEQVVAVSFGFQIAAAAGRLFWEEGSDLVSTSLGAPATGERIAEHPMSWAVTDDRLSYLVDSGQVESMPLGGGPSLRAVLPAPLSTGPMAADATGAYWHYDQRNDPAASRPGGSRIQKFTYATGQVSDFAPAVYINFGGLQSDGEWVVWADNDNVSTTVYRAKPDGSMLGAVGRASIVRGLALHGSTVFWAASLPGDEGSDIWSAALDTRSEPRLVACRVQSVYGLLADANDVYYFTYTANPIIGKIPRPR